MPRFARLERLPSTSARWRSAEFRDELTAWVSSAVGAAASLEPVKIRPWATVWRAAGPAGVHYAKQNCPAQAYEAALLAELAVLAPHHVVPVTAVDLDRGLLLTPDQGPVLGHGSGDIDTWCRVVQAGAALQREVAAYADLLAAVGLTTLEPLEAVAYVEQLLQQFDVLAPGDLRAMRHQDRVAVVGLLPEVARWAGQVAALGLPTTLVHNDLHGNNVVEVGEELRFFDFGDAMLMEPLAALQIPLDLLAFRLDAGPDDPRLWRVADAAIEVWSDLADAADLRAALPAALQLGRLGRTETWVRCTAPMDEAELEEWGGAAAASLASLRRRPPVGHLPG
ncbi:phosphotransferase [Nocardioides sp. MAHUQ-72]|uniref:phosphotransferase n=1 Tax=unclassified Nocardioides TaxID=2615069 RepID=UPI003623B8E8